MRSISLEDNYLFQMLCQHKST